jgi:PCI domain-containing protein
MSSESSQSNFFSDINLPPQLNSLKIREKILLLLFSIICVLFIIVSLTIPTESDYFMVAGVSVLEFLYVIFGIKRLTTDWSKKYNEKGLQTKTGYIIVLFLIPLLLISTPLSYFFIEDYSGWEIYVRNCAIEPEMHSDSYCTRINQDFIALGICRNILIPLFSIQIFLIILYYFNQKSIKKWIANNPTEKIVIKKIPIKLDPTLILQKEKVYNLLKQMSQKYNRIHLNEIYNKLNIPNKKVEEIIQNMRLKKEITFDYDSKTQMFEFPPIFQDELDNLISQFEVWEKTGEGKKL